jgi:hypothetical protein
MSDHDVPLSYLMSASDTSLENFELKRMSYAANIEKEIAAMYQEVQALKEAAGVARWLRQNRTELLRASGSHLESVKKSSAA